MDNTKKLKALMNCKDGKFFSQALEAGYSLRQADIDEWDKIPVVKNFYTDSLKKINDKKLCYAQSTFGGLTDFDPERNVCGTPYVYCWIMGVGFRCNWL